MKGEYENRMRGMTTIQVRNQAFKLKRSWPFDYCN